MPNTINSTIKGKAYEYACIKSFKRAVEPFRPVDVEESESLKIARLRFETGITEFEREEMLKSAYCGILAILEMEPKIIEDGHDKLVISLQPDSVATTLGDVRDLLIIRRSINWEIGISVKHNHAALKHSRLSAKLDFGKKWFGINCSKKYFDTIKPIFELLSNYKKEGQTWNSLDNKDSLIYMPILDAFRAEVELINANNSEITKSLVCYLIGSNGRDYYKLIHNKNRTTTIMPFNLFGTLNTSTGKNRPKISIPPIDLPTRIIEFDYKENSKTTLILTMNNGWSISFRIHNASAIVEPSLKFDIQLQSKPENIFYLCVEW